MAIEHPVLQRSALTSLIDDHTPIDASHPYYELALQVLHSLQYQHRWTKLKVHTTSPVTNQPLPRPLVSGFPPKRLYVHPDEQVELLAASAARAEAAKKSSTTDDSVLPEDDFEKFGHPEEEWVLPNHLREKWSLKMFAEVFDAISMTPPDAAHTENKWRKEKRMLMATVQDDSTVVFYIAHDGIVKPRQN
ncbi:hypothetical protein FKW77_001391 [Venturia effusa]|uniref:tRNA-splicing endonuclease subunit Sen15 domain-containing protein n=1 Tax=Venturia effusa TaxID=50376 RepID=A0A517LD74_9PEZI|nr:hypothetical protein FKW77_001391 [Venturia effusa]